jgi:PAS domain-containing protein
MQASAIVAKNLYGEKAKVVYIGPEIANKKEISETSGKRAVDSVITFLELRALFEQYDIKEGTMEFSDFDPPLGFKGSLFPIANGFVQAADMNENLLNSRIITVEGKNAAIKSLDEYEKDIEVIKKHLNICFGNTLIGPGNSKGAKITREAMVVSYAQKRLKNFFRYEWHSNLNKFLKEDFKREYVFDDQRLPAPDKSKVEEVLNKLRRTGRENVGCEDCGYASCKHFAVAVAQGVVVPELCSTYAIQNSKSFIDELKSTNQALKSTQEALKRSEEIAQNEKKAANYAWELTNTMFQKLRAGVVIADANLKIIQANNALVQIIGDEAKEISEVIPNLVGADLSKLIPGNMIKLFQYVLESGTEIEDRDAEIGGNLINVSFFPIKKKEIVGAIVRDMKAPEVQKAEVINRVSEVIEKNLAMVQKIGFLLGEGASDIEKELNSIIEFYRNQGKK